MVHVHQDGFENLSGPLIRFKAPSPGDMISFTTLLNARKAMGQDLSKAYLMVVSRQGIFTVRLTGTEDQIPNLFSLREVFKKKQTVYRIYKTDEEEHYQLFLNILSEQNITNLDKFEYYHTDQNGDMQRMELDDNGQHKNHPKRWHIRN